jgi:hypothetical protein
VMSVIGIDALHVGLINCAGSVSVITTSSAVSDPALLKVRVNVMRSPFVTVIGLATLLIHTSATGDTAIAHSTSVWTKPAGKLAPPPFMPTKLVVSVVDCT